MTERTAPRGASTAHARFCRRSRRGGRSLRPRGARPSRSGVAAALVRTRSLVPRRDRRGPGGRRPGGGVGPGAVPAGGAGWRSAQALRRFHRRVRTAPRSLGRGRHLFRPRAQAAGPRGGRSGFVRGLQRRSRAGRQSLRHPRGARRSRRGQRRLVSPVALALEHVAAVAGARRLRARPGVRPGSRASGGGRAQPGRPPLLPSAGGPRRARPSPEERSVRPEDESVRSLVRRGRGLDTRAPRILWLSSLLPGASRLPICRRGCAPTSCSS